MSERSVARPERRGAAHRQQQVLPRPLHGFGQLAPAREVRGHGRRQGAAGPVRRPSANPAAPEGDGAGPVEEEVHDLVAVEVPSFHQHRGSPHVEEPLPGLPHRLLIVHRHPGEIAGLGQIRGEQRGARQQFLAQGDHGIRAQQSVPALRHHHRVHDHSQPVFVHGPRHRPDDGGRREHPGLRRAHRKVGDHRGDLGGHEVGPDLLDSRDRQRVLRGDGGDRRHPKDTVRRERLEVGLDASPAPGVRPRDRERYRRRRVSLGWWIVRDVRGGAAHGEAVRNERTQTASSSHSAASGWGSRRCPCSSSTCR